ncbi:predicted protein [Naegleria gruberi]|uniref:Peroxin-7 n=1 Tax=Naegleria gruberi TaxID=5762 RepID=D2VFM6_NAEGR|nr:Peroxin 7 (Pex7), putative [Naegleria gruberi]EFC44384.1 predicted protein [Naegleria gruberi]|eukprot:XP_002677128.1 predicted protein [Naegleria gruberi strain NEG-M]
MPSYKTQYSGYSVEFSPFEDDKLGVATSQHFGIAGQGRQYVLQNDRDSQTMKKLHTFDSADGLYDCTWNEENENQIISCSGDGSIKVFDTTTASGGEGAPVMNFAEHSKEVYSVDYNTVNKDCFVSGSWDNTIKLWNLSGGNGSSMETFDEHRYCVYSTIFSPINGDHFMSCSGDMTMKIWDIHDISSLQSAQVHNYEVLACDWNKFNEHIVCTGSVDKTIKVWDLRNLNQHRSGAIMGSGSSSNQDSSICTLTGHGFAIRRLKFSPHDENIIGSVSYDMSLCIWDTEQGSDNALLEKYEHHSEFVVGIDFNLEMEDEIASCSWDETVYVWMRGEEPGNQFFRIAITCWFEVSKIPLET